MKYVFIAFVKFYQKCISPLKPSCCRFEPTCSNYAIEAFKSRGVIVGLWLTVSRICRCNPLCKGGYDPVPQKNSKANKKIKKDSKFLSDKARGKN